MISDDIVNESKSGKQRREGEGEEERRRRGGIIKRDVNEWKQEEVTYFKMSVFRH